MRFMASLLWSERREQCIEARRPGPHPLQRWIAQPVMIIDGDLAVALAALDQQADRLAAACAARIALAEARRSNIAGR